MSSFKGCTAEGEGHRQHAMTTNGASTTGWYSKTLKNLSSRTVTPNSRNEGPPYCMRIVRSTSEAVQRAK
eukprot:7637249-Pyramimonas_sp.AAC.1